MLGWGDERFTEMDLLCDFRKKRRTEERTHSSLPLVQGRR